MQVKKSRDWGLEKSFLNPQCPIPNPQSPIPSPQSPIPNPQFLATQFEVQSEACQLMMLADRRCFYGPDVL
jgi:hypothetical protein